MKASDQAIAPKPKSKVKAASQFKVRDKKRSNPEQSFSTAYQLALHLRANQLKIEKKKAKHKATSQGQQHY